MAFPESDKHLLVCLWVYLQKSFIYVSPKVFLSICVYMMMWVLQNFTALGLGWPIYYLRVSYTGLPLMLGTVSFTAPLHHHIFLLRLHIVFFFLSLVSYVLSSTLCCHAVPSRLRWSRLTMLLQASWKSLVGLGLDSVSCRGQGWGPSLSSVPLFLSICSFAIWLLWLFSR